MSTNISSGVGNLPFATLLLVADVLFSPECNPQLSITEITKWPCIALRFSYVQPVTQHYKQRTLQRGQSSHNGKLR